MPIMKQNHSLIEHVTNRFHISVKKKKKKINNIMGSEWYDQGRRDSFGREDRRGRREISPEGC